MFFSIVPLKGCGKGQIEFARERGLSSVTFVDSLMGLSLGGDQGICS